MHGCVRPGGVDMCVGTPNLPLCICSCYVSAAMLYGLGLKLGCAWLSVGFCMCLHCIQPTPLHNSLFIPITLFAFSPVLKELFNQRHIITAEECSEVAGYKWQWIDHLVLVLAVKPVEAVEEATKVMKLYDLNTQQLHCELMHQCIYMYIRTYMVELHVVIYYYVSFIHKYICMCL